MLCVGCGKLFRALYLGRAYHNTMTIAVLLILPKSRFGCLCNSFIVRLASRWFDRTESDFAEDLVLKRCLDRIRVDKLPLDLSVVMPIRCRRKEHLFRSGKTTKYLFPSTSGGMMSLVDQQHVEEISRGAWYAFIFWTDAVGSGDNRIEIPHCRPIGVGTYTSLEFHHLGARYRVVKDPNPLQESERLELFYHLIPNEFARRNNQSACRSSKERGKHQDGRFPSSRGHDHQGGLRTHRKMRRDGVDSTQLSPAKSALAITGYRMSQFVVLVTKIWHGRFCFL
jgi:hypothetical protein